VMLNQFRNISRLGNIVRSRRQDNICNRVMLTCREWNLTGQKMFDNMTEFVTILYHEKMIESNRFWSALCTCAHPAHQKIHYVYSVRVIGESGSVQVIGVTGSVHDERPIFSRPIISTSRLRPFFSTSRLFTTHARSARSKLIIEMHSPQGEISYCTPVESAYCTPQDTRAGVASQCVYKSVKWKYTTRVCDRFGTH
jgi:hypothetical protein